MCIKNCFKKKTLCHNTTDVTLPIRKKKKHATAVSQVYLTITGATGQKLHGAIYTWNEIHYSLFKIMPVS